MLAADPVQLGQHLGRRQGLAVQRDRVAVLVADLEILGLVGRLFGREPSSATCPPRPRLRGFRGGGLRTRCAAGSRPSNRARRLACASYRSGCRPVPRRRAVFPRESRSHSRHGAMTLMPRLKCVIAEFEAHLVIALAGRAMRDGLRAGAARDLDLALGNQRTRDRCPPAGTPPRRSRSRETSETRNRARTLRRRSSMKMFSGLMPSCTAFARAGSSSSPWPMSAVKVHDFGVVVVLQPFQDDPRCRARPNRRGPLS